MGVLEKQYIKDNNGTQDGVILAIAEYEGLLERLEELEDVIAYDKAKTQPSDPMSFDDFLKQLENWFNAVSNYYWENSAQEYWKNQ